MPAFARVLGVIVLLAWAPGSLTQSATETSIREVVTRQLDAMKRGDAAAGFAVASPAIQTMFGDAANFMSMVEKGYPQIYRSRGHRFLKLGEIEGKLIQRVLVESDSGMAVARYEMIEIDGAWRINGCAVEKPDGA